MKKNNQVYIVTSLADSPEADLKIRMRNYTYIMIIRTLSILLLFVVPMPYGFFFILIGVFAPLLAVVYANNKNLTIHNTALEKPTLKLEGTEIIKGE